MKAALMIRFQLTDRPVYSFVQTDIAEAPKLREARLAEPIAGA
jgi:hypothetical protein